MQKQGRAKHVPLMHTVSDSVKQRSWAFFFLLLFRLLRFFFFSYFSSKRKKAISNADTSKSVAELVPTTKSNAVVAKGDNSDGKPTSHSWVRIRQIAKVAPWFIATAFIAIVAIGYFFRSQCCESANTLNPFTLLVRYPGGPPPVWAGNMAGIRKISTLRIDVIFGENG